MTLAILHGPTAVVVAAATSQPAQVSALLAEFGAGDVTVLNYAGATLAHTATHGPMVADSATPRGWKPGALLATAVNVPDVTITRRVYRTAGGVDVYQLDAADLTPAPLVTRAGRRMQADERSYALGALPVTVPSEEALILTGPSSGLERTLSGLFTVTHTGTLTGPVTITLSDGDAYATGFSNIKFWPLNYSGSLTASTQLTLTLSPSNPSASFWYSPQTPGAKSITLTNDGGLTNPAAHSYTATAYTAPSATPFRLTRGGSTIGSYATLQACKDSGAWQFGDVVKCTGGTYVVYNDTDPGCTLLVTNPGGIQTGVNVDTLTVEWETPGVPMVLDYSRYCSVSLWGGGQPQLVTMGADSRTLTVRGLHFRGARPPIGTSWIGAGVWTACGSDGGTYTPRTLTIEYCKFWHHADGIHTQQTHYGLSIYVRYCVFEDNSDNQGLRHDIYSGKNALLHVEGCALRRTAAHGYPQLGMGHFIKSRCRATTIKANLLDGYMSPQRVGGVAQLINTPNGGVVQIVGNVLNHYGYYDESGRGEPLRYGDDQHTAGVDTSTDPALTTHSLMFAQNTVRQYAGHTVGTLTQARVIGLFPGGDSLTTLLNGAGTQIAATATIQNNLLASEFTAKLSTFLGLYPNNSAVSVSALSDLGLYSGTPIAGSPATNNADKEWAGDFTVPVARSDTNRGGRTPYIPSWVPTTAWRWTDVPGTNWDAQVSSSGSGSSGAPAITGGDPGPSRTYVAVWDYSGPTYSRKNHEFWMFGGGHAATTINILTRYNLHQNTPDVTMVSAPTSEANRAAWCFSVPNLISRSTFPADSKPYSPHSYFNNLYRDGDDEFVSLCLSNFASSSDGFTMGGGALGSRAIFGYPRTGGAWRAESYYTPVPTYPDGSEEDRGPRALTSDGSVVYYWPINQGLKKFTFATNTHSSVGGPTTPRPSPALAMSADDTTSLHVDVNSDAGWGVETRTLATGARQVVSVTGYAPPTGMACYGVEWVPTIGKYVVCWINTSAYNGGGADANLTSVILASLTMTSESAAAAAQITVAVGDGVPTKCGSIRGMAFDPLYGCLLFAFSHSTLLKALKVA